MGAIGGEELVNWENMQGKGSAREEKILVLVRLRPLSEKEIARNEVSDWECINNTSILFRNSLQERSMFPTAYTYDRVFGGECPTRMVYDSGAKEIALSVVSGINSSIFAYGQTSSGKTYTMTGITEYTVADVYDYIQKHEERAFVLKFSAMEIYNEAVRDLLSTDNTPLRVLDDPEKGTTVEKLTEETLKGWSHLKDLLSICEAQRQTGETSLNETSSRSHQILRLTIESSAREFLGKDKATTALAASVNFVDLAGSERAAQALSVGQRLKEGCHINRSLLTLSTVIRKLSKGRHGHVNYRDSKLTRILQPCLGGNARTAIICTLSPARSHVEQSRNTLLFASCAKEVTTNAQVNIVMSDKALVKHLQKELARLESELKTPAPTSTSDSAALLRRKDLQIDKLEKEVRELTKQRDLAQSRIEELLTAVRKNQEDSANVKNDEFDYVSDDTESSVSNRNKFVVTGEDSDDNCKDVRCIEMDESTSRSPVFEERGRRASASGEVGDGDSVSITTRETSQVENGFIFGSLEHNIQDVQKTIKSLVMSPYGEEQEENLHTPSSRGAKFASSWSGRANLVTGSSSSSNGGFGIEGQNESTPPPSSFERNNFTGRPEGFQKRLLPSSDYKSDGAELSRNDSQSSIGSALTEGLKSQNNNGDEDIPSVDSFVAGLKEMAKAQYDYEGENTSGKKHVKDVGLDPMQELTVIPSDWPLEFERQQRLIVELWETCNVSLVHRTYFFLLFRGDPMDSIYMEVEIRRLSFLKEKFSVPNPTSEDGQTLTLASSMKALRRERETLSRLMYKRFSDKDRNRMYEKWGISLESKRRRMQLVQRLWSDTKDMNHVEQSATIIAKLVRFAEQGQGQALKGMFGLSFTPPRTSRRSLGWKHSIASLL